MSLPKTKTLLRRGADKGEVDRSFNRFCIADLSENINFLIYQWKRNVTVQMVAGIIKGLMNCLLRSFAEQLGFYKGPAWGSLDRGTV